MEKHICCIIQSQSAVDYKHLITELNRILEANDLDIDKPDFEDDLFPSNVNGITDYSDLAHEISIGEAEISRMYLLVDEWAIRIVCNYQMRALLFGKFEE